MECVEQASTRMRSRLPFEEINLVHLTKVLPPLFLTTLSSGGFEFV